MDLIAKYLGRIISGILSLIDASNLRNRVYQIEDEHEIMWTALDDIARMYKDTPAGDYASRTMTFINSKYEGSVRKINYTVGDDIE